MRMEPTGCSETSVRNYHYWLRNNPEERSSHLRRGGSLKSLISCVNKVVTLCFVDLYIMFIYLYYWNCSGDSGQHFGRPYSEESFWAVGN